VKVQISKDVLAIVGFLLAILGLLCTPVTLKLWLSRSGVVYSSRLELILWLVALLLLSLGIWAVLADRARLKKNRSNFALLLVTTIVSLLLLYAGYVSFRSIRMYRYITTKNLGFKGRCYTHDSRLGYSILPNSHGFMTMPLGDDIPARHDQNGFRIPVQDELIQAPQRPLILALGCSFTYGAFCLAEETYPYLTAKSLGGSSINAGVCAYGVIQMLLEAEDLVPKYKPDYVLVTYADWLARRSLAGFTSIDFGKVPVPFFTKTASGEITIHPALFKEKIFELPIAAFQETSDHGILSQLSFVAKVGLPLYIHDDFNMAIVRLQDIWSRIHEGRPFFLDYDSDFMLKVIASVYKQLQKICDENGAKMIAIKLRLHVHGGRSLTLPPLEDVFSVNADSALVARLPDRSDSSYNRAYCHWRGSPPVFIDIHINPLAHKIIAEEIVKAINQLEAAKPPARFASPKPDSAMASKDQH